MKTYTNEALKIILDKHLKWLKNEMGGERANLSDSDLSGTDLRHAILRSTDLRGATLTGANLAGALQVARNTADAVIVSTGAQSLMLGLEAEQRLLGHGVSTCATCDGFFFRNQEIAVVGGGDSALEEANFLTKFASKVTLVHRRDEFRASKIMQDRAFANPKIEVRTNTVVEDILDGGKGEVTGVRLKNIVTGDVSEVALAGVFVAIGHTPNTSRTCLTTRLRTGRWP